jgi:hypothetical protein
MNKTIGALSAIAVGFVVVACSKPSAQDSPAPGSSAASTPSAAAAAAAPADPKADYTQIAASCDTSANLGECSEYKEIGLLGDSIKSLCVDAKGTYSTTARCPKDGRVGMCTTDTKKLYYYKKAIELGGADSTSKFCKDMLMGQYFELAKPAAAAPSASAAPSAAKPASKK